MSNIVVTGATGELGQLLSNIYLKKYLQIKSLLAFETLKKHLNLLTKELKFVTGIMMTLHLLKNHLLELLSYF